jgi:DNA repair exonuclease SbcCD ATPase subunit
MQYKLNEMSSVVSEWVDFVNQKFGELNTLETSKVEKENQLEHLKSEENILQQVRLILQAIAKQTQDRIVNFIDNMMTLVLHSVFEDDRYSFKTIFQESRGKTEVRFVLLKGNEEIDPLEATGGGVVDILCFGLRIIIWSLTQPRSRPIFVFDEPFRFLSRDLHPKAVQMLRKMSERLGIQIIMISHSEELIEGADVIFRVRHSNGLSEVIPYNPDRDRLVR